MIFFVTNDYIFPYFFENDIRGFDLGFRVNKFKGKFVIVTFVTLIQKIKVHGVQKFFDEISPQ
jgi:hypothetical protein